MKAIGSPVTVTEFVDKNNDETNEKEGDAIFIHDDDDEVRQSSSLKARRGGRKANAASKRNGKKVEDAEMAYMAGFLKRGNADGTEVEDNSTRSNRDADMPALSYEELRAARIKRNEERLRQSGLMEVKNSIKRSQQQAQAKKRTAAIKRKSQRLASQNGNDSTSSIAPRRSSRRGIGKPVMFSPTSFDDLERAEKAIKKRRSSNIVKRDKTAATGSEQEWTTKQRASLAKNQDWLEKFHTFLLETPHGRSHKTVSEANARMVMRQVRLLTSGKGVTYHHWPKSAVFCPNKVIDLSCDFDALYDEAQSYEDRYGKDLGNGWLMRHPIVKMKNYQTFLLEQREEVKHQE